MKTLPIMAAALFAISASSASAATTITFEEQGPVAMSNSPGSVVPLAAQLTNYYLNLGVKFSSGAGFAAIVDHGFPLLTPSPPGLIGGTAANGTLDYSSAITASFFNPGDSITKATVTSVSVFGDLYGLGSGSVFMKVFDVDGNLLGSVTDSDAHPLGTGPVLTFSGAGIHSVNFYSDNATVGFDNFTFDGLVSIGGHAAGVPEPANWAMLLLGFGLIGGAMRTTRRRKFIVSYT